MPLTGILSTVVKAGRPADGGERRLRVSSKSEATEGRHAGPIIVRKRVHGAHEGHHGGAWKVAYADASKPRPLRAFSTCCKRRS